MAVKVIITRAAPGSVETARRVANLGFTPLSAPMLELYARDIALPDLSGVAGLLFTSANGVRFFAERVGARPAAFDLPTWCVGPATLGAAREAGFALCESANGNAQDLAELVMAHCSTEAGPLLHVANAAAAGKLGKVLGAAGFDVVFVPLYAAAPMLVRTPEIEQVWAGRHPAIVLVHSAKAASAFAELYRPSGPMGHHLVAVSAQAARPLQAGGFAHIHIAARPNEVDLMTALTDAAASL